MNRGGHNVGRWRRALLALALGVAPVPARAAPPVVDAAVEPPIVTLGESAEWVVTVRGTDSASAPQPPAVDGLSFGPPSVRQEMRFANGRMDRSASFRFAVRPDRSGEFSIGPLPYRAGSDTVEIPARALRVVPPGQAPARGRVSLADLVFARLEASPPSPYVQQRFALTLSLYHRGVEVGPDLNLTGLPATALTVGAWEQLPTAREEANGVVFEVRRFRATAQALSAGPIRLAPTLRVQLLLPDEPGARRGPFGDPFFDRFFDDSLFPGAGRRARPLDLSVPPVELNARALPAEGRPPSFTGGVGAFEFDVEVKPRELAVGDPVTVTMSVRGTGNPDAVSAVSVPAGDGFRAYEARLVERRVDERTGAGEIRFEQVLIPRDAAAAEVPELAFSYFDPVAGDYRTIRRGPFPLRVAPATNGAMRIVSSPGAEAGVADLIRGEDLVYLKPAPSRWRRPGAAPWDRRPLVLYLHLLPPAALAALYGAARRRAALASDVARARREQAPRVARAAVRAADQALRRGDAGAFFEALWSALAAYFGHRFNLPPGAVTADVVLDALRGAGAGDGLREAVRGLFEACEGHRFGGGSADGRPALERHRETLMRVLRECERSFTS